MLPAPLCRQVHHDQNTAVWAPQGPRVLTFFMYLNEVGGPHLPCAPPSGWCTPSHMWVVCHPHHAGIPSPTPRPPAPAQVGGGGETYFPNVRDPKTGQQGIMVQPHPGSAILWPSTLDAEPMRADMRTPPAALEL